MCRWKKLVGRCLSVCVHVCPSIFASGARTAGRIRTGGYPFDAPERREDDEISFGPIGCTWDVPRVIVQTPAKMSSQWFSPNQWMDSSPTWWADSHYYWAQLISVSDGGTPFACVRGT